MVGPTNPRTMAEADRTPETPPPGLVEITRTGDDDVAHALVDGTHALEIDEPEWIPIGGDRAPSPANYLLVATAGCQVEVLAQAFDKARITDYEIAARASRHRVDPGEGGPEAFPTHTSWRYLGIRIELVVETTPEFESRAARCLEVAEEACIVSRSVEAGIDVEVDKTLRVRD